MSDHEKSEENVEDLDVTEAQAEDVTGGVLIGLLLPAVQHGGESPAAQKVQKVHPGGANKGFTGGV